MTLQHTDAKLITEAMGRFLDRFDWAHFHTLTFAQESGEDYAVREWGRWRRLVEREAGVALSWFFGVEYGRLGRLHLHALTGNTERLPADVMRDQWRAGHSRILPYDRDKGATHYVSKYVTKQLAAWDLSENAAAILAAEQYRQPTRREARRLAFNQGQRDRTRPPAGDDQPATYPTFFSE